MIKGIDISHWQGDIDFKKVAASGIQFVIIKAGGSDYGFYKDKKFEQNYLEAKAAGLMVGAYYFVGKKFYGMESGVADAKRFIAMLQGKDIDLPVFVDIETTDKRFKAEATDAAIAFCETVKQSGYIAGIYASDISGFKERLNVEDISKYVLWVARYNQDPPSYIKDWDLWQYTSKGSVDGISGSVDLDYYKVRDTKPSDPKPETSRKSLKKVTKKKKSEDK